MPKPPSGRDYWREIPPHQQYKSDHFKEITDKLKEIEERLKKIEDMIKTNSTSFNEALIEFMTKTGS